MRTILILIKKEFLQLFRNKLIFPILFVVPFIQLVILVNAATFELKNIRITIVDKDRSTLTTKLKEKFKYSPFFQYNDQELSFDQAKSIIQHGNTDVIVVFPDKMEKTFYNHKKISIQIIINAINGVVGGIANAYVQQIIKSELVYLKPSVNYSIHTEYMYWYNPQLNYKNFMVPAILVILVTIIGMVLSAINYVREKEIGTLEQINVSPIYKYQFILGKLIPFWLIAFVELLIGLTIGKLLYDIPIEGNVFLLLAVTALYLIVVMNIGILVAISSSTQQQALFLLIFILLVLIMLSGIFTSVETMPYWAQKINILNPIYHIMRCMRMILLKGSGVLDLINEMISLSAFSIMLSVTLFWQFRKNRA